MACYTTIITTEAQKFLPPEFERCNMSEVDHIKNVTIVGIGTQGSMIAFRNALYGKNVTGYSRTQPSIDTCKNKIDKWLAHFIEEGKLTKDEADAVRDRIHYATTLEEACKDADLVVENVPEKIEVKQAVFKQLDEVCPKHCYDAALSLPRPSSVQHGRGSARDDGHPPEQHAHRRILRFR